MKKDVLIRLSEAEFDSAISLLSILKQKNIQSLFRFFIQTIRQNPVILNQLQITLSLNEESSQKTA